MMGIDPCGTCFHRWDFWNDCEECSGRATGAKWKDGVSRIAYHQSLETEMVDELARVQRQLVSDNIQAGINRRAYHIQMQAEVHYEHGIAVKTFVQDRFSTPEKAKNSLNAAKLVLGAGGAYCGAVALKWSIPTLGMSTKVAGSAAAVLGMVVLGIDAVIWVIDIANE